MSGVPDYALGTTVYIQFTTRAFATGVPTTLAGTPACSVLEENNATPITSGVSISVDRASVTGLNEATIVASSGNGYESGKSYALYISTGTVGGTSVVGEVVGCFTIEKQSALRPTTAGRTLDVSAGGEAGVDWANVGSPTTSLNLSGTTIATTQKVDIETIKTQSVTAGAGVTFPATIASTTNITAGTITTVTNLTNAPTNGDFTAVMKTSIGTAVAASAVASVTGNVGGNVVGSVGSVVGAVGSVTGAVGSVTGNVGGNVAGSVGSVTGNVGGNVAGSVNSVTQQVSANITAVNGTTVNGDGSPGNTWGP